jgi:hypothetical protein
MIQAQ